MDLPPGQVETAASLSWLLHTVLMLVAALVATVVLVWAWVWSVRRFYNPGPDPTRPLRAVCADGWSLAVYHRAPAVRRFEEPILLGHGLAANRYNFDLAPMSLSSHLADLGFECFVVDWRGTGGSRRPPPGRAPMSQTFDEHVDQDAPALLDLALRETGARRAFWVGHSLGGLVGYAVAQGPEGHRIAGLVTLGSPAALSADRVLRWLLRLGLLLSWPRGLRHDVLAAIFAPMAGRFTLAVAERLGNIREMDPRLQRQLLAHQIAPIGRPMLRQLADWIDSGSFRSIDRKRNYRDGLAQVTVPVLCVGGSVDRMAPPESVVAGYERLGSQDKTLVMFGGESGHAAEYGHADLVFGRSAPAEVYPVVSGWLESRATRTMPAS